jgi:multiple sugar transport system permease protein
LTSSAHPGGAVAATKDEPALTGNGKKKPLTDRAKAERRTGWLLCAPAVIVMLLVTGYPIIYALYLSLQRYDLRFPDEKEFVGLSNYGEVLTASVWWTDVLNTAIITVISVAIELTLGMIIALVMHRAIFGRGAVRTAVLIPYGIVTVVAAYGFLYAFTKTSGFVPALFGWQQDPFSSRAGSFAVIILTEVWKTTPFMALLLLAGLSLVPDELHEAAKVDGASAWQRFWRITVPLMKPAILVALLFRTLDAFRVFDTVFIQTRGANNTETVSILGYNVLIQRVNLGIGSAISVMIFICVLIIAFIFVKVLGTSTAQQRGEAT